MQFAMHMASPPQVTAHAAASTHGVSVWQAASSLGQFLERQSTHAEYADEAQEPDVQSYPGQQSVDVEHLRNRPAHDWQTLWSQTPVQQSLAAAHWLLSGLHEMHTIM